tara:strand:+ start:5777 stop:7666 length:1890 start_codon:yes stop_codon:yes gene_type:complete
MSNAAPPESSLHAEIARLEDRLTEDPMCFDSREKVANLLVGSDSTDQATEHYAFLIQHRGSSATLWNKLGYTQLKSGELDAARESLELALALDPEYVDAELNLATLRLLAGELSVAERAQLTEQSLDLGDAALQGSQHLKAMSYFSQALVFDPDNLDARYWVGIVLLEIGQVETAQAALEQLVERAPDEGRGLLALASAVQAKSPETARKHYRAGLLRNHPHLATLFNTELDIQPAPAAEDTGTVDVAGNAYQAIAPVVNTGRRPFWSVIIPVYGRTEFLAECLASVLNQSPGAAEMEIIVLDNGSEPSLASLVNDVAGNAVSYYRRDTTLPLQQNWNSALALARGRWIHLLHDDDFVLSGYYETLAAGIAEGGARLGGASCGFELIDRQGKVTGRSNIHGGFRGISANWIAEIGVTNALNPPCPVISREAYERVGAYRTDFTYTIDWEMYMRVACHYDWWLEPAHLARYRIHDFNVSTEQTQAGVQGPAFQKAIELARNYLPPDQCAAISTAAAHNAAAWCLQRASAPLQAGNPAGTLAIVQQSLQLQADAGWRNTVCQWMESEPAKPFREVMSMELAAGNPALASAFSAGLGLYDALSRPEQLQRFLSAQLKSAAAPRLYFTSAETS